MDSAGTGASVPTSTVTCSSAALAPTLPGRSSRASASRCHPDREVASTTRVWRAEDGTQAARGARDAQFRRCASRACSPRCRLCASLAVATRSGPHGKQVQRVVSGPARTWRSRQSRGPTAAATAFASRRISEQGRSQLAAAFRPPASSMKGPVMSRWSVRVVCWSGAGSVTSFRRGRRLQSSIRSRWADQGVVRCQGAQSRPAVVLFRLCRRPDTEASSPWLAPRARVVSASSV